jgi:hypothetical protein
VCSCDLLKKNQQDTYGDREILKTIAGSGNPDVTTGWLERIEKLRNMNVLPSDEAEVLKDLLFKGRGKGRD